MNIIKYQVQNSEVLWRFSLKSSPICLSKYSLHLQIYETHDCVFCLVTDDLIVQAGDVS